MSSNPTVTLGSFTCDLYLGDEEPNLGAPDLDFDLLTGPLADDVAQGGASVSGQRTAKLPLCIAGVASSGETKRENCVRQLHNLDVELGKSTNTLTLKRRDSTISTVYEVMGSPYPEAPYTVVWDRGGVMVLALTLNVKSWALGTEVLQTLCTAQATPSLVDVTVAGNVPAPLTLIGQRGFAGSGLQTLIVARVAATATITDMLLLAKDATAPNWDGFDAVSGYTSGDDNVRIVTSASAYRAMYWSALPVGRYALYVKCRVQTGGKGWLAQSRSSNDPSTASVAVTDNDWRFVRLGDYASDGYTALRIVGKCREAANGLLVDWVLAVPLTYGTPAYFHCTAVEVNSVSILALDSWLTTTASVIRSARRYVSGSTIEAVGTCRLLIAACDAAGDLAQPKLTLATIHTPRYVHWVPTTEED